MKKKGLVSLALAVALGGTLNAQSSGFFAGINAGVPITTPSYSGALGNIKNALPKTGIGYAVGIDLGYKQAISENYGLKYYLSYNYNQSYGDKSGGGEALQISKVKADIQSNLITANVDFWYNFTKSFGAYLGVGVGYQSFKPNWKPTTPMGELKLGGSQKGGIAVPLNVGLTYNFNDAHQILLGAKIPLIAYDYKTDVALIPTQPAQEGTSTLRTYIVQIGYNLTF